jgi:uncharacterized membrane protein YhaH (DUF805 family)
VPSIAVATRRLHDTGRSGWKELWSLTITGAIFVVVWMAQRVPPGPNRFDPDLLAADPGNDPFAS